MNLAEVFDEDLSQVNQAIQASSKALLKQLNDEEVDDDELARMLCEQATDGLAAASVLFAHMAEEIENDEEAGEAVRKELAVREKKVANSIEQLARVISVVRSDLGTEETLEDGEDLR